MRKIEDITAQEIVKEYVKISPTYNGKDAAFLEENFESFRRSMLASVRDRIPSTMISLDKNNFRGRRTIALLNVMGIAVPKSMNELAQIFATIYPDHTRQNKEMRIKNLIGDVVKDKLIDSTMKNDVVNEIYIKLSQSGYLW